MRVRTLLLGVALASLHASALAAWHEAKSKHFVIYADQKPDELAEYARQLEKFDQAVRFVRNMDDPPVGEAGRLTIFVLPDAEAVARLVTGKNSSLAGYYIPSVEGSVAFVPKIRGDRKSREDASTTFFHEYAHHLMLQSADAPFPAWLIEGFAEFFSTAKFPRDGDVLLGNPAAQRAYGLFNLGKPRIEDLLTATFDNVDGERGDVLYGRSWLLTHFLAFNEARKGQQSTYIDALRRGVAPLDAAKQAFGDLSVLERDLDSYLRRNKFLALKIPGSKLTISPVSMRPLSEGEVAIIPTRMQSANHVTKDKTAAIATQARAIAARFPGEAAVQTALAKAEYDAGNFAAASAAADRALAVRADHGPAMMLKGKSLIKIAESSDTADWKAIRGWFSRANRLDPENPEPLLLYFQSFGLAGEAPTRAAVSGLLYSVLLAPQDPNPRITAASYLISEKKHDQARQLLAPLANGPHPSEAKDYARKLMDSIPKSAATKPQ